MSAAPVFHADGTITGGAHQVRFSQHGIIQVVDGEGNVFDLFVPLDRRLSPSASAGWLTFASLKGCRDSVDERARSRTFTAVLDPDGFPAIPISYGYTLTAENRVRVRLKVDAPLPPNVRVPVVNRLHVSRQAAAGSVIAVGADTFPFSNEPPGVSRTLRARGPAEALVFHPNEPARRLVFHPVRLESLALQDRNVVSHRPPFIEATFEAAGGELVYDIELPADGLRSVSKETYGGVDFWAADRLAMPQYGQSRNLIQNPGFEAGFAYWRWNTFGSAHQATKHSIYYEISEQGSHTGRRALALRGEPGISPAQVATFAIPVEKGAEYTLSFFARADRAGRELSINAQGLFIPETFPVSARRRLSAEWERHVFIFKAPHPMLSVGFGHHNAPDEGWIYVDSVQLEKASAATDFTTKPVLAWLETASRGRLWQPGENPAAALLVEGPANAAVRVGLKTIDFFGRSTERPELDLRLDAQGRARAALSWAAHLPSGPHAVEIHVKTEAYSGIDYDRLTVMSRLSNQHARKNIFSTQIGDGRYVEWERAASFFSGAGIGSAILFDPVPHEYSAILARNRILHFSSIFDAGHGYKDLGVDLGKSVDLSAGQLAGVEARAFRKASEYPELTYWKLNNEPPAALYIKKPEAMRKMNAVLLAARRGILRANPDAMIVGSDPSNMYANSGQAFVETQLEAARAEGKKVFDVAAIHPYRARPEEPDRDAETRQFLSLLDRNGFKGDVWFTEGIYHQNYNIPAWGLNVHVGCSSDGYRAGPLSYAMGWGERMAAAYTARSWLVSLKYADRVKLDVDWGFRINAFSDVDYTPMAPVFAANTLGRVLGDSTFKTDLSLGYQVRCYVFEDAEKRPVAAIWGHDIEVDKGSAPSPLLDLSALLSAQPGTELIDFVGVSRPVRAEVEAGPFPVFLRGLPGSTAAFVAALSQAHLVNDQGSLHAWLAPVSETEIQVVVENTVGKEFAGTAVLRENSREFSSAPIRIPARGEWKLRHPLRVPANTLVTTKLTLALQPADGSAERVFDLERSWMRWPKRRAPISFSGNLDEWRDAFQVEITNRLDFAPYGLDSVRAERFKEHPPAWAGPDDFSARLYATWDEKYLYLALAVRDDVLHPAEKPAAIWNADSVQLYFDGWADAVKNRIKGYGPDDQSFLLWPRLDAPLLQRDVAPERQLAFLDLGPVTSARLSVRRIDGLGTFYETALPLADINPVLLAPGTTFGFSALVNDHDGDYRKRALTLTSPGTEPYRRPDLYPVVRLFP